MSGKRAKGTNLRGAIGLLLECTVIGAIVALCGCASVQTTIKVELRQDDIATSLETRLTR